MSRIISPENLYSKISEFLFVFIHMQEFLHFFFPGFTPSDEKTAYLCLILILLFFLKWFSVFQFYLQYWIGWELDFMIFFNAVILVSWLRSPLWNVNTNWHWYYFILFFTSISFFQFHHLILNLLNIELFYFFGPTLWLRLWVYHANLEWLRDFFCHFFF
jgi:hypothetical protein